jgi:hypothetical protein
MNMRQLYMQEDRPFSVVPYLADLLDAGIPIVVYNGDRDMTTNMVGTELLLNQMEWSGKEGWLDAPRGLWKVDEYPAGWAKEYNGLSFVVVYNSGHMVSFQLSLEKRNRLFCGNRSNNFLFLEIHQVPYNQPINAFDLLKRLLTSESFIDVESPLIRVASKISKEEDILVKPQFMMDSLVGPDMRLPEIEGGRHLENAGLVIVSIFAGFVLALLFVHRRAPRGYQQVPNARL